MFQQFFLLFGEEVVEDITYDDTVTRFGFEGGKIALLEADTIVP